MQVGTRWAFGTAAPSGLPEVVLLAVRTVEEDLTVAPKEGTDAWRWTLTWLESKPVIELDDGTVIRYDQVDDSATITQPSIAVEDDEDWI